MSKALYKITVKNFSKYNSTLKKGHKATLISNNFCSDDKLGMLPLSHRWLFLGILLTCGDHTSDTIELNERHLRDLLESSKSIESALDALESLQLLSYEKIDFLLNIKEKKVREYKRKEVCTEPKNLVAVPAPKIRETIPFKISFDREIEISRELLESWSDTFPKEFIEEELKKARSWILSNPHKAPKSAWGRFFNRWLNLGWERYRTTLKSNPVKVTVEDLQAFMQEVS